MASASLRAGGIEESDGLLFVADELPVLRAVREAGRIGRFLIFRELGRGAVGVVFAAYDEELDRKVAIKLLHAARTQDTSSGRSMLMREAQALARLAHPNVVAVHEVGTVEGAVFVAMEYVAGVDLQRWLAEEPRSWREVVAVFRQAGAGLVAAHREGLVHRDFKPGNVLVGDDGRVRVADFGLAARRGVVSGGSGESTSMASGTTATLAREGALIGTPVYMAPELLHGGSATASSDQYAFCVALYEALYGQRPFDGATVAALTADVERRSLPAAPPRAEVPAWLHAAVCRGLAKQPEGRYPALAELVDLLARDPAAERQQRRRRALHFVAAIVGTVALVTAAILGYGAASRYAGERRGQRRLEALRGQIAELRARGDATEARRSLRTFVALPENRGLAVVARAYLEWGAAQTDHAEAVDAYGSAYITARTEADARAALLGLIDGLSALRRVPEAAAALAVLERVAPQEAARPELRAVRLAAALSRRDLPAAAAVSAGGGEDDWGHVLEDLSHVTEIAPDHLGPEPLALPRTLAALDLDGDGAREVLSWRSGPTARLFRADVALTPIRTIEVGEARRVEAADGESLLFASYPTQDPSSAEVRMLDVAGDLPRVLDVWPDSVQMHANTLDFDGDGRREVYLGTEAYARRFWRIERDAGGVWTRRSAHAPTDAAGSDVSAVLTADLDGDGRPELVAAVGPWKAYDLRVFKPTAAGELDLVARRAFGSYQAVRTMRAAGGDLLVFSKVDGQIAPGRFPADKPLGEPAGIYVVGLRSGSLEILDHVPAKSGSGARQRFNRVLTGDLDGDGQDEAVIDVDAHETMLLRRRPDQPLRPQRIGGLTPLLLEDLDRDGRAELLAATDEASPRLFVLGAGSSTLPPLPATDREPRPIPPGIADPAIAQAWTQAEQLAAIGLPRRTADELSDIAGISGNVEKDMLYRTGELYAAIGEDALAAERYVAAAGRPDLASRALAGAAAARRRLGEFAAAEALTRQRLAAVEASERGEVEAELAALTSASAPRPELALEFGRPLDPRWQIVDPVAVRRSPARQALSVWASRSPVLAELPVVWSGGPVSLEVELEVDRMEWGNTLTVVLAERDQPPWLLATIGGFGQTDRPVTRVAVGHDASQDPWVVVQDGAKVRARMSMFPGLATTICEIDAGEQRHRFVSAWSDSTRTPAPGPLSLRVLSDVVDPGFVGHVWVRSIRLTGVTAESADSAADTPAWLLAEGELASVVQASSTITPGSAQQVWQIDALLGLGEIDAAAAEIRSLLAATPEGDPVYNALHQRLRRGDEAAWLAARASFGSRFIDLVIDPSVSLWLRPEDAEVVLHDLAATDPRAAPADPLELQRLVTIDYARGAARLRAGRLSAAREAFGAAYARVVESRPFPAREQLHERLLSEQLDLAAVMEDRAAARQWIDVMLTTSETPYLMLERMQADAWLSRLFGPEVWAQLQAQIVAARP
ncbi:serine/threonine-protein kinase [Nannocystis punicea]|uniref:Protein kinase n=1 Tax=Nannocystis punicea TaxID=2995304 RepID=A0ABY7H240_9BACT|nr:protein kinase [Nannocystis poenicansa]WAS93315.1 protein kinase [Nannocystis poenicansa]